MAPIIDDDVKISPSLLHEAIQELNIGLIAREYGRLGCISSPFLRTGCIVLNEVQIDILEVFEPGIEGSARTIGP